MISSDETAIRVLNNLLVLGRDGERGYQTAAAGVRDPELTRTLCEYATQRGRIVADLEERIKTLRATPKDKGSLAGKVHRKWMEFEAASAEGVARVILKEIERAEGLSVMAYKEALQLRDLDEQTRRLLQQQYELVQAAHDRIRQLRESAAYAHR